MATAPRKVEIRYASLSWWKEMREPTAEEGELFTQKMKLESGAITNAHDLVVVDHARVDHRWRGMAPQVYFLLSATRFSILASWL